MGFIAFLGMLRQSKSGQVILNIPKKFKDIISIDKLVYIKISNTRADMKSGEMIHFDGDEKTI